jgi:hypothetical protein
MDEGSQSNAAAPRNGGRIRTQKEEAIACNV